MSEKRILLAALCCGLLCSCSESQDDLFPEPLEPITELDCNNGIVEPPMSLGVIDGWAIDTGWESRVVCEHRHSHRYVDASIAGNLCLGLNRDVGAMAAHPPVADGPGTYTVKFAAQQKQDQLIEVALSRGTDSESPDWARSVSVALECFRPCEGANNEKPRQCRPVVRLHDMPGLDLKTGSSHERYQALPGHSAQDYELKCALNDEYGFPLPTTGTITAEIVLEGRSVGWKIDGALVSGFGPSYQLDHARWSCERADGTPVENAAQRLFVVGLPFAETTESPKQSGYELTFEHWSPDESLCAGAPPSASESDGAWMCVRDARYASCNQADCPEACGDGTCDIWETCSTCASDCKICGPQVPDLAIVSIDCGQSLKNGELVSCDIVLVNQGNGDTSEFDNQLWLSPDQTFSSADKLLGSCISSPIKAGSTSTITCGGVVPTATEAGTWYLGFVADSSTAVVELDENNNFGDKPMTVVSDYVSPADLIISSVNCFALIAETGKEVECWVTVDNIGGLDTGPFLVDLRLSTDELINGSDTLLNTCQIFAAFGGMSHTITCAGTIPLGTPLGTYYLGVIADNLDAVPESNENNNTGHESNSTFVSAGPADLLVSSVSCPMSATSPGPITCSVTIKNQGDKVASFVKNEMRLSNNTSIDNFDTLLGQCDLLFPLPPGQSKTIMCSGNIPMGVIGFNNYVGIITDSPSSIAELDEKNNTGYASVSIQQGQADLVVSAVSCPMNATSPGSISCSVTIKNQGASSASSFTNEMWLSSDTTIDTFFDKKLGSCNVVSLPAGQAQTITCNGTIPTAQSGLKYVIIDADSSFPGVSESNENNNTGSVSKFIN